MAQFARPISTVSAGSWTDEGTVDNDGNLHTSIDEVTSDGDDSYIEGNSNTTASIQLGSLTDPEVSTGHVLHVLFRSAGSGGPEKLDIRLMQGTSTEITTNQNNSNRSATYTDLNYSLPTANADAITDYTDLRVELIGDSVGGGESLRVTQVYFEVPDAPTSQNYTLTASQGSHTLTGQSANLTKDVKIVAGQGSITLTGQSVNLPHGRTLTASQGSLALTGQSASLIKDLQIIASQGSYTLNGQNVTLTYSGGGEESGTRIKVNRVFGVYNRDMTPQRELVSRDLI